MLNHCYTVFLPNHYIHFTHVIICYIKLHSKEFKLIKRLI